MKKKQPLVCIVIVNWNGGEKVLECVSSLIAKTDYKNYKILVVDNGSTDGSPEKIGKNFEKIKIIRTGKNLGFTKGTNFGWNYCLKKYKPEYICDMNNDIVTVQKDWLSLMVNSLEKNEGAGICGNKLIFPDGRLQLLYLERDRPDYNEKDHGQYDFIKKVQAVGGANMLIKVSMVKKIGGRDENFFYGPDDIDYCLRARNAGFEIIYNGFSKSIHIGSFSYLSSNKDRIYLEQSYGQMVFAFRHGKLLEKIKMSLNQFARIFITRKDPFNKKHLNNLHFHLSFPKRFIYFLRALFNAIISHNNIKNDYLKKLNIE